MPDHHDFLQAILADPDDDAPRLIYADWLEEQGDGQRAEFIRVQVRLAQLSPVDDRWKALNGHAHRLLAGHQKEWAGAVPDLAERCEFHRGFVESVHLPIVGFTTVAERLFAAAPIRSVRFLGPSGNLSRFAFTLGWDHFAASPELARLRTVDLSGCSLGDERLARLVASPHLGCLRELQLRGNGIGDRGVRALAEAANLASLTEMDLRFNRISSAGVRALLTSPHLPAVRIIWLESNPADVRNIVRVPGQ